MTTAEFRALFEAVSNWGRWGERGARGALNYITPESTAAAVRLVRTGVTVTLSLPLSTEARMDSPEPADYYMTMMPDDDIGSGTVRFAKDYIGADYHNEGHTHVDAFSHVAFDGLLYDGQPDSSVTSERAAWGAIDLLERGLVGRGVLLDIPRVSKVSPGFETGRALCFRVTSRPAERAQGVSVEQGDTLLVRTGPRPLALAELPPWDTRKAKAGLSTRTDATFLAQPVRVGARLRREQRHQPRAPPKGSAFFPQSTYSPLTTRWECTCSTTCSSRTS
jgi:hypothetical protein